MSVRIDTAPEVRRPGVGVVLVSTWRVGTPERQQAAVEAITRAWRSRPWPDSGLLSYSVSVGTDGDTLMHYSQWRDLAAYEHFARTHRGERNTEIDAAVPGIQRLDLHTYQLHHSGPTNDDPQDSRRTPGCLVAARVTFEGSDQQRQLDWIDTVHEALAADATAPGGIAGHFHTSLDGTRVLVYAEWESEEAHDAWLSVPGDESAPTPEHWRRVQEFPGVATHGFTRYVPAISLRDGDRSASGHTPGDGDA